MKCSKLSFFSLLILFSGIFGTSNCVVTLDSEKDLQGFVKNNSYVVKVYSDGCGFCKKMEKPFKSAVGKFSGRVGAAQINVATKDAFLQSVSQCFQGVPGFFYVNKFIGSSGDPKTDSIFLEGRISGLLGGVSVDKDAASGSVAKIGSVSELIDAIRSNDRIVLKFTGQHCGACKVLAPTFINVAKKYGSKVAFYELDGGLSWVSGLMKKLGVRGIPTVFFIRKDTGACSEGNLIKAIASVTGQSPEVAAPSVVKGAADRELGSSGKSVANNKSLSGREKASLGVSGGNSESQKPVPETSEEPKSGYGKSQKGLLGAKKKKGLLNRYFG